MRCAASDSDGYCRVGTSCTTTSGSSNASRAREHRGDLLAARVVDHDHRPVSRLVPMARDDVANLVRRHVGHARQQLDRALEILAVLAEDRDVERAPVLDEHAAFAIEDHAARRTQRQRPLVVVLRHLLEPGVLRDLEEPEAAGKQQERDEDNTLNRADANGEAAFVFSDCHTVLGSQRSAVSAFSRCR